MVARPPERVSCTVCFTPLLKADVKDRRVPRCPKHVWWTPPRPPDVLDALALPADPEGARAPQLRECPGCGRPTFREQGKCSTCEPTTPPLQTQPDSGDGRRARQYRKRQRKQPRKHATSDGRIIPELAREIAKADPIDGGFIRSSDEPVERPNGLKLDPDTPHLDRARPHAIGNRCKPGEMVSKQRPARDAMLGLMEVPGEWEVVAIYTHGKRVKAATWYLRHKVLPTLPAGTWEVARCWWEHAAVMGRYTPP